MADYISRAAVDVVAERVRQIHAEGYTPAHDAMHSGDELAAAAAAYACAGTLNSRWRTLMPKLWPWDYREFRLKVRGGSVRSSRRRMLVKAGALILAAIEWLDREADAAAAPQPGPQPVRPVLEPVR